jgi:Rubrerythrin
LATEGTLGWLIDKAIAWENMARDLYATLPEAFASQPAIGRFWQQMSDDESEHAKILKRIRAAMPPGRLSEPVEQEERERVRSIDWLWSRVGAQEMVTLDDVYELAHELESSEINTVFRFVALGYYDEAERRNALVGLLDRHVNGLEDFGRTYGKARRRRLAITHGGSKC